MYYLRERERERVERGKREELCTLFHPLLYSDYVERFASEEALRKFFNGPTNKAATDDDDDDCDSDSTISDFSEDDVDMDL